jgi:hypothetical protein
MNRKLKRIEQTLNQLDAYPDGNATALPVAESSISFPMNGRSPAVHELKAPPVPMLDRRMLDRLETQFHQPHPVQPINIAPEEPSLHLPKVKSTPFTSHRNGVNPDLAINLLQDMLVKTQKWRAELKMVLLAIETLYHEGPIVDGWLESSTDKMVSTASVLRHESIDRLMDYVDELCADPGNSQPEYRLCGLNADGKAWSCPCPSDQIASISIAIARHQKLQIRLNQKLQLETQLKHAAESLVKVHGQIHA